jgi:hypothetical protein
MEDWMWIAGAGIAGAALYLYFMRTGNRPVLSLQGTAMPGRAPWPMQVQDPNITNAYNRAKYSDQGVSIPELYGRGDNASNDFLNTFAPTATFNAMNFANMDNLSGARNKQGLPKDFPPYSGSEKAQTYAPYSKYGFSNTTGAH